jgi:hypothetical protein
MTGSATRTATTAPPIPRPRDAEPDLPPAAQVGTDVTTEVQAAAAPELPPAQFPWPEPWRSSLGARPRTEYWDVTTAGWHSRGPRRRD